MNIYYSDEPFYRAHYNCSSYSVDSIPLAQRRHPVAGVALIAFFVVCEALYIPCVLVIRRHTGQSSCYKFMFFIGVVDVVCLLVGALTMGVFALVGMVYCMAPRVNYVAGYVSHMCWRWESTAALCLALNRCISMSSRHWSQLLYDGYRAWLWVAAIAVFGAAFCALTFPATFSGVYFAWTFNPHAGYDPDTEGVFVPVGHQIHNYVVLFGITGLYVAFCLLMLKSRRVAAGAEGNERPASQRKVFLQAAIISGLNAMTAAVYAFFEVFPEHVSPLLVKIATINWVLVHGMPAFIYLTMNPTIRREWLRMVGGRLFGWRPQTIVVTVAPTTGPAQTNWASGNHH